MREWLRARWRWIAGALAVLLGILAFGLERIRAALTNRKDMRTDRKLERAHDGHVAHEARAGELEAEAEATKTEADSLQTEIDFSGTSADEVAAKFRELAKERGK